MGRVQVPEEALRLAADIVEEALCPGNRAEILLIETAKAAAALDGLTAVTRACLREAASFVLPHRMTRIPPEAQEPQEGESGEEPQETPDSPPEPDAPEPDAPPPETPEAAPSEAGEKEAEAPEGTYPLRLQKETGPKQNYAGEGKRVRTRRDSRTGRMIRSAPRDRGELAVCDTLKEAAIHRARRPRPPGLMLQLRDEDIRRQIKEGRTGATILFVVDASGSMGVRKRIRAAKSAVMSLLQDAYEKNYLRAEDFSSLMDYFERLAKSAKPES